MSRTSMTALSFLGTGLFESEDHGGRRNVVTTIPKEKAKAFVRKLSDVLSGNPRRWESRYDRSPKSPVGGMGGILQVHRLHGDNIPRASTMSCSGKWRTGWPGNTGRASNL